MDFDWTTGAVSMRCPVCSRDDDQDLLATSSVEWRDEPIEIARCRTCRSILLSAVEPPTTYFDETHWDDYLEQSAGLEAIAQMLQTVAGTGGSRMLDVGCGYGFALDLASFLFGWEGIGIDPSIAADRGREELGVDIRSDPLDDAAPGEVFDVIFASEILEHVHDPAQFLSSLTSRLSDHGVLVLTTPDADAIRPETSRIELLPTLQIGAHVFLVDSARLEQLLHDAGLEAAVWSERPGLRSLAARSGSALARTTPDAAVDLEMLVRYCAVRADGAPLDSPLRLGMSARHFKYAMNLGDFAKARDGVLRLRESVLARYDYDITSTSGFEAVPGRDVLVGVHYFLGILALNGDLDPVRAAEHFVAAARAAQAVLASTGDYKYPETPDLEFRALGHRAIALAFAQQPKRSVRRALKEVERASARGLGDPPQLAWYRTRVATVVEAKQRPKLSQRARSKGRRVRSRIRSGIRGART